MKFIKMKCITNCDLKWPDVNLLDWMSETQFFVYNPSIAHCNITKIISPKSILLYSSPTIAQVMKNKEKIKIYIQIKD